MMKSRIRKGNALVLVTIVMFAVALIAASLTMYFSIANRLVAKNNRYFNKRIELSNEANHNYALLLNGENSAFETEINKLDVVGEKVSFTLNGYQSEVECKEYTDSSNFTFMYSLSTIESSTRYTYSVEMNVISGEYQMSLMEAYGVYDIS